jgi:HPr kinase/phosphorylase
MPDRAVPWTPKGVALSEVVARFDLEVVTDAGVDLAARLVTAPKVNRPGLQWAGYSEHFPVDRIQLVGRTELEFLEHLDEDVRDQRLEQYAQLGMPAVVVAHGIPVRRRALRLAGTYGIPILRSRMATSELAGQLDWFLAMELAPRAVLHGGLVDVAGEGVLILGESGVGKSETALELVHRGHLLIADDTVEVRRPTDHDLIGRGPGRQRAFMEVKGIGIVNVRLMYGVGSVKPSVQVTLVVRLVHLDPDRDYAAEPEHLDVLGVPLPLVTIPMRPGRNAAVLIETAASNVRARRTLGPRADVDARQRSEPAAMR